MAENKEEEVQNQIYQSFSNNIYDNSDHANNSPFIKENNVEFTFKKNISGSNKAKDAEKELSHNIYSKNDENIKQSGHFFNEANNESKYKQLLKKDKDKYNNIIKPLFKYIIKKKNEIKNMKMNKITNKIFAKNLEKINNSKINYFKKNLKLNNIGTNNSNSGSNITTLNNNTLFNVLTKSPLNSFLEISHESYNENNEITINENKENLNFNSQNFNISKYQNNFTINKKIKIFDNNILTKSIEKRNTNVERTRNKQKNKKDKNEKYKKNISFEVIKNYKELKQKIIENKIKSKMNKNNKINRECLKSNTKKNDQFVNSNKNLIFNLKINKKENYNSNSVNILKKNIKQNNFKNLKKNIFSPVNGNTHRLNESNHINSHRRLKTISPNIFI